MDCDALVERIRRLRPMLGESGVTHVAMFGSRAPGDHREDSDLDLLIDVQSGRKFSLLDLIGVQHSIGDDPGVAVDAAMRRSLEPEFDQTIQPDVVVSIDAAPRQRPSGRHQRPDRPHRGVARRSDDR